MTRIPSIVVVEVVELWKTRRGFSKGLRKTSDVFQGVVGWWRKHGVFVPAVHSPRQPRQIHNPPARSRRDAGDARTRILVCQASAIRRTPGGVDLTSRIGCPLGGGTNSAAPGISLHPSS